MKFKFLPLCLCFMILSSLAFSAGASLESDVSNISSKVNSITGFQQQIYNKAYSLDTTLDNVYSRLGNIYNSVDGVESSLNTISSRLFDLKEYTNDIEGYIDGLEGYLSLISQYFASIIPTITTIDASLDDIESNSDSLVSDSATIRDNSAYLSLIDSDTSALVDFFVNPHHQALEDESEDSVVAATGIYRSDSAGTSTSQKLSAVGDFGDSLSSSLDTGVATYQLFDMFDSGSYDSGQGDSVSILGFFSQRASEDMDSSLSSRSRSRSSSPDIVTNYYHSNYESILSHVGDNNDK